MGTDCKGHIEIKFAGEWHHYSVITLRRNYESFEWLHGLSPDEDDDDDALKPLCPPGRGLPKDVSAVTQLDFNYRYPDTHCPNWIQDQEIFEFLQRRCTHCRFSAFQDDDFGYLFGQSLDGWFRYPEDGPDIKKLVEGVRFVFWFDQ